MVSLRERLLCSSDRLHDSECAVDSDVMTCTTVYLWQACSVHKNSGLKTGGALVLHQSSPRHKGSGQRLLLRRRRMNCASLVRWSNTSGKPLSVPVPGPETRSTGPIPRHIALRPRRDVSMSTKTSRPRPHPCVPP